MRRFFMICNFCYRHCNIEEGSSGFCNVRKCIDNKIVSPNYGYLDAIAIDPIEKKPLYHFLPGTKTLSVAEVGCNFHCDFCQNWQLSQSEKSDTLKQIKPQELIDYALAKNIPSISFTYSEPIVWQDYVVDTSALAKEVNIKTVMVTNGSFSKEARESLAPLINAFNIDLKGDEYYYKNVCKGELKPVLDGIEYMVEKGCHVEVTTLLLEEFHTIEIVEKLGKLLKERGVEVWHLTRFFPTYKMNDSDETSETFLARMIEVAKGSNIPYIYGGNSSSEYSTYCNKCKKKLISRNDFTNNIEKECKNNIKNGKCSYCNNLIYGIFS